MKRPKFVKVVNIPEPRASKDGRFRRKDDVLKVGTIVPGVWFEDTPDDVFALLINPPEAGGLGVIEECEPDIRMLMVLKEMYPGAFPAPEKNDYPDPTPSPSPAGGEGNTKRKTRSKEEDGN